MSEFVEKYGPWAIVAGASDGTGSAFAEEIAARGVNVVLVSRRQAALEEVAARIDVETRVVPLDLSADTAPDALAAATDDLEIGLLVYNAGADSHNTLALETSVDSWHAMVRRNCATVLGTSYHYGNAMVDRGRGGLVLVTSGAAWVGGSHIAVYAASKAFDLVLGEGLWAEWHDRGVDVLSLVLGATDTPALRRSLETHGGDFGVLADPADVARDALDHIGDGPTWQFGFPDPAGGSPFGALPRRQAVELMSQGSQAMFSQT